MNGMDKIKAKLEETARAELAALEADTKTQVDSILAQGAQEAQRVADDILERGKKEAADRGMRISSSAQMECRKIELAMKQDVISEAFDKALENLCGRSEKDYVTLLVNLALGTIQSGNEVLIFSEKDKGSVGKFVVDKINEVISGGKGPRGIKNASVILSEETRAMPAGFIMLDGDVEINCDFDTLVRLQRNELELEVARVLF